MSLKKIEQRQMMFKVGTVDEVTLLITRLIDGGTWDDEQLPDHITGIIITPDPELPGRMMVQVVYMAME